VLVQVLTTWSVSVFPPKEGEPANLNDGPSGKAEGLSWLV